MVGPKCNLTLATCSLTAVNASSIQVYGTTHLIHDLDFAKSYPWDFLVADVLKPIIGADFLQAYEILPDLVHPRLIARNTLVSTPDVQIRAIRIRTSAFSPRFRALPGSNLSHTIQFILRIQLFHQY